VTGSARNQNLLEPIRSGTRMTHNDKIQHDNTILSVETHWERNVASYAGAELSALIYKCFSELGDSETNRSERTYETHGDNTNKTAQQHNLE
jgi:hypothetical protein